MSAAVAAPRLRDARAASLRRSAFDLERLALGFAAQARTDPERRDVAEIARRHADEAWNLLWLYLDGLIA